MKTKIAIFLAIVTLVLVTLACSNTQPTQAPQAVSNQPLVTSMVTVANTQPPTIITETPTPLPTSTLSDNDAVSTRQASIQTSANFFLTPENWLVVPQSCRYSMAHLSLTSTKNPELGLVDGSGNLVFSDLRQDSSGKTVWIYHFLTATHLVTKDQNGNSINDKVVVQPLDYVGFGYQYALLNEATIVGDNGFIQDTSLITIIGLSPIDYQGFTAIGVNNVVPGTTLTASDDVYFQLGYPRPHHRPQFVTSKITNIYDVNNLIFARLMPEGLSSATDVGQSGGALCNQYGQLVGVHSFHEFNIPDASFSNLMPNNIQDQINQAIYNSNQKLADYGFSP